jgi:uncharacterized protein
VVFLFGLLHDCRREDDGKDPKHGPRAATFAATLADEGLLNLPAQSQAILERACELHSEGLTVVPDGRTAATIGACWDADRLNLVRLSTLPDDSLLSTTEAKRLNRDSWSWALVAGPHPGRSS